MIILFTVMLLVLLAIGLPVGFALGSGGLVQELFFFDDADKAVYDLSIFNQEKCGERLNWERVLYFVYTGFVNADRSDFDIAVILGDADESWNHHETRRTTGR